MITVLNNQHVQLQHILYAIFRREGYPNAEDYSPLATYLLSCLERDGAYH